MTDASVRRADWARLLEEHAAARAELVRAVEAVAARSRDPLGLKAAIQDHPLTAVGVAASAGALLVSLLAPRSGGSARDDEPPPPRRDAADPLIDSLRDSALQAVTPWVAEFLAGAARSADPHEGNGSAAPSERA